ncbi:hypothetical protein MMC34_006709 [Xylographa carneopallida]|nr:hypothetical protein [Xylographa carneopallida]
MSIDVDTGPGSTEKINVVDQQYINDSIDLHKNDNDHSMIHAAEDEVYVLKNQLSSQDVPAMSESAS